MKIRFVLHWIPTLLLAAFASLSPLSAAIPLEEALDTPGRTWEAGGTAPWIGQSAITHDGADAAQAEGTNGWSSGFLNTSLEGPGVLTFWWKVAAGGSYAGLRFSLLDGPWEDGLWLNGNQDWQFVVVPIPLGSNAVQWMFDGSGTATNTPYAWLDQVVFTNTTPVAPTITNQPQSQVAFEGTAASFTVWPDGSRPFTYQWYRDGTPVPDATNQTLRVAPVASGVLGTYYAAVSNALGGTVSSNATLSMIPSLSLAVALDTTNLTWQTGGPLDWVGQTNVTHDGVDAAQSGHPTNQGWMAATVMGPGTLTFWYWSRYQSLEFKLTNGVETAAWTCAPRRCTKNLSARPQKCWRLERQPPAGCRTPPGYSALSLRAMTGEWPALGLTDSPTDRISAGLSWAGPCE